ncbi:InlB B-repeat-containing protein, partial [Vagococcus fessus]
FNFNQGITKDTTVYAKWSDKKYTVRFETNGGDKIESQTVQHGKTSTEPVPPTYGDKGFEGWYADSKFETVFDFTKPITKDTVVYAKWRIQKYKVQFDTNGGSKVDSQSVEEGKKSTKPTDPTYPAKEFKGWYKTNEFIEEFDFDQPITEDITLYAKWRSKILDPKDGKTPVTPVEGDKEKPQNNTSKELRIQYVSDFDFGKVKNSSLASQELSDGDSVLTDQNEKKEVPSFISIIDDRPKNKGSWSLYSKATSFVSQTGHEMMGAELILKDLNYAKEISKTPSIEGNSINLSTSDSQLITKSSNETSNGSWSLAFGSLNSKNKSTGAVLSIPRNTIKANTDYHSVIEWTLVPEI